MNRPASRTSVLRIAGFLCALLAFACAGNFLPPPSEALADYATRAGKPSTVISLQQGRSLFVAKCDGCHSLPYVQDYSPEKWVPLLDSMKVQAELTNRQDTLIRNYVIAAASWLRDSLALQPK